MIMMTVKEMVTTKEFRKNFPIFENKIQLSSCSQSAMHHSVKTSIDNYMKSWEFDGMDWEEWVKISEQARALFAKQIGAKPDEIAIVSSVSHAAAAISTSLEPTKHRNKVVITDFDFPTIGHVWGAAGLGFTVDFLKQNENGYNSPEEYATSLPDDLLLLSTSHVNFYHGYKQDIKKIASIVHDKGGYLFVDAYQSFGQTSIDVKEMDVDFLAAGMQKYSFGIPGIAFLYVNERIANTLTPKLTGWFGQTNPFAFDIRGQDYAPAARRFDSGTFPMINGYATQAALNVLDGLDISVVEKHLQTLSGVAAEELEKAGLVNLSQFPVKEKGSNTAVLVGDGAAVESEMAKRGIIVAARNEIVRIAPHYYSTEEDIKTAVQELKDVMEKRGSNVLR